MPRACPERSRRGGRRPGAGAPRGNLNALKHGLRSRQLRQVAEELARSPAMRAVLARFARLAAQGRAALQADQAAALAVATWLRYTRALERGEPWQGVPPIPPFSYRQARLLARRLAHQTIKQGLLHHTHAPPEEESAE